MNFSIFKKWLLASAFICIAMSARDASAQHVIHDGNGANLFIQGTDSNDSITVFESQLEGDSTVCLYVWVNSNLHNITASTGLRGSDLYSIGAVLYGGDDTIVYVGLLPLPGGVANYGGAGYDKVIGDQTPGSDDSSIECFG